MPAEQQRPGVAEQWAELPVGGAGRRRRRRVGEQAERVVRRRRYGVAQQVGGADDAVAAVGAPQPQAGPRGQDDGRRGGRGAGHEGGPERARPERGRTPNTGSSDANTGSTQRVSEDGNKVKSRNATETLQLRQLTYSQIEE